MTDPVERQVHLEAEALELGRRQYQRNVENHGHADSAPGRRVIGHYLDPLAASIAAWVGAGGAGPGKGRRTASLVAGADPRELALLTLRSALSSYSLELRYMSAAVTLGGQVEEHEGWSDALGSQDLGGYARKVSESLARSSSQRHGRAVVRHVLRVKAEREPWTNKQRAQVGLNLLERLLAAVPLFTKKTHGTGRRSYSVLDATDELREWLEEAHEHCMVPVHLPMVIPPIPWSSPTEGGYVTRRLPLVKGTRVHDVPAHLQEADLGPTYAALNLLQETPWRINRGLAGVMREAWEAGSRLAGLPARDDEPVPAKPVDIGENEEARRAWRDRAASVHRANGELRSQRAAMAAKLAIASRFEAEPAIYFPHQLDWRGRAYPVGSLVHPQADDSGRALLQFSEGVPLGEDGAYWLAVHLANTFGADKVSLDERVDWVEAHEEEILDSALAPLDGRRFWVGADKPWSFLAACFEWLGYATAGDEHVSHLPVAQDGSCNGLQHFSALLRDEVGGRATNLVPADQPADIYRLVADATVVRLRDIAAGRVEGPGERPEELAAWWDGRVSRAIVKRPVMTVPYGVTLFGMRDQIADELRRAGERGCREEATFLSRVVWESIGEVVVAARQAMAWLQEVAKLAVEADRPLCWTSPMGFPVVQRYQRMLPQRLDVWVAGRRCRHNFASPTDELHGSRQVLGISPNYVHSLDAAHMMQTVLLCAEMGIPALGMVHDSYAVHAGHVTTMNAALRHTFVQQYEQPVLRQFRDEVQAALGDVELPPLPEMGGLEVHRVMDSLYFFA